MNYLFEQADVLFLWISSPGFYWQCGIILAAASLAWFFSSLLKSRIGILARAPEPGVLYEFRSFLHHSRDIYFPLLTILFLGIGVDIGREWIDEGWLVRVAQSLAVIFLLYSIIPRYVKEAFMASLFKWIGIPLVILYVFGWLDDVNRYFEGFGIHIGNINISVAAFFRVLIFGGLLFWLGRISNTFGKNIIRNQQKLDASTREVFTKLFEIALVIVIFLLLLQVMGVNLTALAVFGGALGVGLGFGLQQIASNFISGIIILLDRSISIGDYIELEDGRTGILRELNMRSATLETFEGKDIMVPNETFITSAFTNWTHKDKKQRYSLHFQVAYKTDLDLLFEIVRKVCADHPSVISGPDLPIEERPDAEIEGFGDSGINILVEFWMEGIDDGRNRVGADLLYTIWQEMRANNIEIPFPQREVNILNKP